MANTRVGINAAVERENLEVIPFLGWAEMTYPDDDLFFDVMVDDASDNGLLAAG
jgi:hypothetical protein